MAVAVGGGVGALPRTSGKRGREREGERGRERKREGGRRETSVVGQAHKHKVQLLLIDGLREGALKTLAHQIEARPARGVVRQAGSAQAGSAQPSPPGSAQAGSAQPSPPGSKLPAR
jgi:hypothetical protein